MVSGMAGCGGGDAGAGGMPAVSGGSAVTPSVTPTPTPSEDPLFTEAKAVHLKYLEAMVAMDQAGGQGGLSESMKAVVSGEFQQTLEDVYAKLRQSGLKAQPNAKWRRVRIVQDASGSNHVISITACVDFTALKYVDSNGKVTAWGSMRKDVLKFDRRNGSLVISEGTSGAVKSCDA
jgi:hypothetical protein